jgi:hypothetical protein
MLTWKLRRRPVGDILLVREGPALLVESRIVTVVVEA